MFRNFLVIVISFVKDRHRATRFFFVSICSSIASVILTDRYRIGKTNMFLDFLFTCASDSTG